MISRSASPSGRYAPSPTGEMHLGNGSSALWAWLSVRGRGGRFVLRMEDLDRARVRPEHAAQILADLRWLGLDWDEGPDVGGPSAPYEQSARLGLYRQAFDELERKGLIYPCFCSRRDIAASARAPQSPGDELRYPGTCRHLGPGEAARGGRPRAWRFRVDAEARPRYDDRVLGPHGADPAEPLGDFVVFRADGLPAYQLAVVVDDDAMGIDEVVRGNDLADSALRQLLLIEALGRRVPVYGHVPLLVGPDGVRLSKRHRGIALRELREAGVAPDRIVGRLAHAVGLLPSADPVPAAGLIDGFDLGRLRHAPLQIPIDPAVWRGGA